MLIKPCAKQPIIDTPQLHPASLGTTPAFDFTQPFGYPYTTSQQSIVTHDTMLIQPANRHHPTNQSLILNQQNELALTPYSTRQLIQHYNHQQLIDFSQTRHLCRYFDHHRKIPQINGDYQFLPLGGTAHQNTSWVALHYVTAFEQFNQRVLFRFLNGATAELDYHGQHLEAEIHNCAAIGRIIKSSTMLCSQDFGYQTTFQSRFPDSIIHQYDDCTCSRCQKIPQTTADLVQLLDELEINKSKYIYKAATQAFPECAPHEFDWYNDVSTFIKKLRRL